MADSTGHKIARNTIFLYFRMIIILILSFYTTRILLKSLGIYNYGVYNVVCGFVSMLGFVNASLANGSQRFYNIEIGKNKGSNIRDIFTASFVAQIIVSIAILVIGETIGLWYLMNVMVIPDESVFSAHVIYQLSLLSLLITVMQVPYTAAVMAYERMGIFSIISILDAVLRLIIVFIIQSFNEKLIFYSSLLCIISIIDFTIYYIYCHCHFSNLCFCRYIKRPLLKEILSFSGWNIFGSFAHVMQNQGINLVINLFWGPIVNASFGIANQIQNGIRNLNISFLTAVRPQTIQLYAAGKNAEMLSMTYTSSKISYYLIYILTVPIFVGIVPILDLWLGANSYPYETATFCRLSLMIIASDSLATPISIIVHATGKMKKFQIICSMVILLVIPFSYICGLLKLPPSSALIVSAMICLITQGVRLMLIKNIINFSIKEYLRIVMLPILYVTISSTVVLSIISCVLPQRTNWEIFQMIFSLIIVSLLIYHLGLNSAERMKIRQLLRK